MLPSIEVVRTNGTLKNYNSDPSQHNKKHKFCKDSTKILNKDNYNIDLGSNYLRVHII